MINAFILIVCYYIFMDKIEVLKYYFGYGKLKPEQEEIIDSVLNSTDTIGLLPTGYGKSITFQIPALLLDGITLVITPLIALMQDQVKNLKDKFIPAEFINSLLTMEEVDSVYKKLKLGKIKILYVSAERLESKRFKEEIKDLDISLIVADEAHTLLWSEDFRRALGHIPIFINSLKNRPKLLALTATATNETTKKITTLLNLYNPKIVIGDCDRKNIFYKIIKTTSKDRDLYFYIKRNLNVHGIIYCLTVKNVLHVYEYLRDKGLSVGYYHGAMDSIDKKNIQNKYTNHEIDIIICTNAFGMGIDIPDIRYVIEYDLPSSIEDFSQQSGRCSRDGKYAESVVLFNINDIETIEYFIDHIDNVEKDSKEIKRIKKDRYNKLDEMVKLCIGSECIHKRIANYFGVKHNGKCNMCSNCTPKRYTC